MKLIWSYDAKSKCLTETERITLLNYYIMSITSAKRLGYHTIMVCNENENTFWKKYVVETKICDSYENSPLWDSFKMRGLELLSYNDYLIDGDVILHDKLPINQNDIVFDSYEILNWKNEYEPTINKLTELGIGKIIHIWDNKRIPIINCGILSINNLMIRLMYLSAWKKFNQFIIDNINEIDTKYATGVGAQYLLSLIINSYNFSSTNLTQNLGEYGDYYKHYYGSQKYISPIVPTDYILSPNESIKLF